MSTTSSDTDLDAHPATPVRGRAWVPFLAGFALLWGALALLGELSATVGWSLLVLAAVALLAVLIERVAAGSGPRAAFQRIGLGRPAWRPVVVAIAVSAIVLLVYPITAAVTRADLALRADWPWLLVGLVAFNGLAEEIVWRGYAFRRLRVGRSFLRAGMWTMPLVAAAHIPIVIRSGPVVGIGALLIAAVTSIPFAYLYETGRGTVWAPALLHAAIDGFKLVLVPASAIMTFSLILIAVSLTVPLLALVVRRSALRSVAAPRAPGTDGRGATRISP